MTKRFIADPGLANHEAYVQFLGEFGDLPRQGSLLSVCPCHGSPALLKRSASSSAPRPPLPLLVQQGCSSVPWRGEGGRDHRAWWVQLCPVGQDLSQRVAGAHVHSEGVRGYRILDGSHSILRTPCAVLRERTTSILRPQFSPSHLSRLGRCQWYVRDGRYL